MFRVPDPSERQRTRVMVALVLAGVAVVGLVVGALVGLAGGGRPEPTQQTAKQAAVLASKAAATPSASPTERADSDVEPGRRKDIGLFLAATQEGDGIHITFDRVQLLAGAKAIDYAKKHNQPPPPGGLLVVNENPRKRKLVLSPEVTITAGQRLAGTAEPQEISVETLLAALGEKGASTVLDVTYDELGYVVAVEEKSLP